MLEIIIPPDEMYNDATGEFEYGDEVKLLLEHSLISISKWESRWNKPFLGNCSKSDAETRDYVKCMTTNKGIDDSIYLRLDGEAYTKINEYIIAPMTATVIRDDRTYNKQNNASALTSEVIYYNMIAFNIPMECEKWHINRLMTLIRVCQIKNDNGNNKKPMSTVMKNNAELNAARRKQMGTKG